MTYPGGKGGSGVVQKIVNQIPPHRVYIEAYLGSGTILRAKRPAVASIGIDIDTAVCLRWASSDVVVRDPTNKNGGAEVWTAPAGSTIIQCDAISFLRSYAFKGDEFVYLDPPYLFSTRSSDGTMYQSEFGKDEEHAELLSLIRELPCMVAISGYWSWMYENMLMAKGWRSINYQTIARSGEVKREYLWMNYPEPQELHDYSFLGDDYREREKLARQRRRWVARLKKMDPLQRLMLSAAIAELGDVGHPGQHVIYSDASSRKGADHGTA